MTIKLEWPKCKQCNVEFNSTDSVLAHFYDEEYLTYLVHETCATNYAQALVNRGYFGTLYLIPVLLSEVMRNTKKIIYKAQKSLDQKMDTPK